MTWLDKLKLALLFINVKGDLRQPQNYAMGRIPKGYQRWYVAQQYFYDVERILRELKAAVSFISTPQEDSFFLAHGISKENYISFLKYFLHTI